MTTNSLLLWNLKHRTRLCLQSGAIITATHQRINWQFISLCTLNVDSGWVRCDCYSKSNLTEVVDNAPMFWINRWVLDHVSLRVFPSFVCLKPGIARWAHYSKCLSLKWNLSLWLYLWVTYHLITRHQNVISSQVSTWPTNYHLVIIIPIHYFIQTKVMIWVTLIPSCICCSKGYIHRYLRHQAIFGGSSLDAGWLYSLINSKF